MTFKLTIVTPDGEFFSGEAKEVYLQTTEGRIGILPGHTSYVSALGMGEAKVVSEEGERHAACAGGMVTVSKDSVRIVATTFEWAENIDLDRAKSSEERARKTLEKKDLSDNDIKLAEARLKRALVRQSVASRSYH